MALGVCLIYILHYNAYCTGFSIISISSIWNSLSYKCMLVQIFSTLRHNNKRPK